jgi:hypothetical protein
MSGWYVATSSPSDKVLELVIQNGKARVAMTAAPDSLGSITPLEVNQKAAKVVCPVVGLSPEHTVALLRAAKDGIDELLRSLIS